jgi:hypothetical protein
MKLFYPAILCGLLLFGASFSAPAQSLEETFPTLSPHAFTNANPETCAYRRMQLDVISQHVPTDKTLIVIARRGERDARPDLNRRRLHNVRAYLTQDGSSFRRDSKTVILAEGERVKGQFGQIEFYLDGRLIEVIKINGNGDFVIDCYGGVDDADPCGEDRQKLFYPCKTDARKPLRKRRTAPSKKTQNK